MFCDFLREQSIVRKSKRRIIQNQNLEPLGTSKASRIQNLTLHSPQCSASFLTKSRHVHSKSFKYKILPCLPLPSWSLMDRSPPPSSLRFASSRVPISKAISTFEIAERDGIHVNTNQTALQWLLPRVTLRKSRIWRLHESFSLVAKPLSSVFSFSTSTTNFSTDLNR